MPVGTDGSGFGAPAPTSMMSAGLKAIDSRKQTFANKDFVKNIAWLNNSVDTLSMGLQRVQQGMDDHSGDPFTQITAFASDLLVVFAGGQPTGIELGDLKYVIQGLGALLGINPDTPFPINLFDAGWHLFNNFVVPLPQFTDLIFDAIIAWAEELGFSDEAIASIQDFDNAVVQLYTDIDDIFGELGATMEMFMEFLGLGNNFLSTTWLWGIWDEITGQLNTLIAGPRQALLYVLSEIVVVIFKILTWIVTVIDPMNWIRSLGLQFYGPNLIPAASAETTDWMVGSNPNTTWEFDPDTSHTASAGSFTSMGNGNYKRMLMQDIIVCQPLEQYQLGGWLKWDSVPTNYEGFGICIVFYNGASETSQHTIEVPSSHTATSDWISRVETITVPQNVDGFKVGVRITNQVTTGQVWIGDISCLKKLPLGSGIIQALTDLRNALTPQALFNSLLNGIAGFEGALVADAVAFIRSIEGISGFVNKVLGGGATVDDLASFVGGLFGPFNPVPLLGTGQVSNFLQNLIQNPVFETAQSLVGEAVWAWDAARHSPTGGSATVDASTNGVAKSLLSNPVFVALGDKLAASGWTKWTGLAYTGNPISLMLNIYDQADSLLDEVTMQAASVTGAASDWVNLASTYVIDNADASYVRLRFNVASAATAGNVWFDDVSLTKPNLIAKSFVQNLEDDLATQLANVQNTWNTALKVFLPGVTPQNVISDFENAVTQAAAQINTAVSQLNPLLAFARIRDNLPIHFGLGATSEVTVPVSMLGSGAQPSNFNITASTPSMGFVRCGAATLKKVVVWHGAGKTNITEFYISIYKMDTTTGNLTRIHTSVNIISSVAAGWNWNVYNIPNGILAQVSDVFGIELRTVGSGSHTIAGVDLQWMPDYPGFPKRYGACRSSSAAPPDTILNASVGYSRYSPCFEFGMDAADVPSVDMPAETQHYVNPADYVLEIHPWSVLLDLIGCGGGGAGGSGNNYGIPAWYSGTNGGNGAWNAQTLVRGVDIPWDTTLLLVHVGGGAGPTGPGSPTGNNGGGGDSTRFSATGYAGLTCPGGGGGGQFIGLNAAGSNGPVGDEVVNGITYPGGWGGTAGGLYGGAPGAWGSAPGGGGGGGNTGGSFPVGGGWGAGGQPGCAYVVQRQS